jgi:hypothetical protein
MCERKEEEKNEKKICTWSELVQRCIEGKKNVDVDSDWIRQNLETTTFRKEFEEEVGTVGKENFSTLYSIWKYIFDDAVPVDAKNSEFLSSGWVAAPAETKRKNLRKYLSVLTDYVLSAQREMFIVDDRFIYKCFEHDLEKVLFFILENAKYYKIQISMDRLQDLYICYSIDLNKVEYVIKLLHEMDMPHLDYALRFASLDFLLILVKVSKFIPNFDKHMEILEKEFRPRDLKHLKVFDYWQRRRAVNSKVPVRRNGTKNPYYNVS